MNARIICWAGASQGFGGEGALSTSFAVNAAQIIASL